MYRVTVEKIEMKMERTKEWARIRHVPDDLKKKPGYYTGKSEAEEIEEYGYVEAEKEKKVEVMVFSQNIENLDLAKVIMAVNGL